MKRKLPGAALIRLSLAISNPFCDGKFDTKWFREFGPFFKTKHLEVQVTTSTELFVFEVDTHWSGYSHAGLRLEIGLFNHNIDFHLYDARHWDYEKNEWIN